jgi:DNA-binding helix-hairpin-helix protein with protein kinase domain
VLLFGVAGSASSQSYEIDYQKLLKLATEVPKPSPSAPIPALAAVAADPAASAVAGTPSAAWIWYVIGAVFILGGLPLLPIGVLVMGLGAVAVALGVQARQRRRNPWTKAYQMAKAQQTTAVVALEQANRFPRYTTAQAALARMAQAWQGLPRLKIEKYQELHRNKRQAQLQQYLQSKPVDSAGVKGIGRGRVAMLSAYGVDTAWDVSPSRVSQVPQFGPVLTDRLVAWRRGVEGMFVYDSSSPLPPEAVARVEKSLDDAHRRVLEDLRRAVRDLQSAAAIESTASTAAAHQLTAAIHALRQAEANVLAATGKVPA